MGALFPTGSSTLIFILSKTSVPVHFNQTLVCFTTCRKIQDMIVKLVLKLPKVTPQHGFYDAQAILRKLVVSIQAWPPKSN